MKEYKLGVSDFAELLSISKGTLPNMCQRLIVDLDLRFRKPTKEERDGIIRGIIERIDSGSLAVAGPNRLSVWEDGWLENLEELKRTHTLDSLWPKYYDRDVFPVRWMGDYIIPLDEHFELGIRKVFQLWLFLNFFGSHGPVHEFGCGPYHNLAGLAQLFPSREYRGYDWAQSASKIPEVLKRHFGWNMHGTVFDMFHPDDHVKFPENTTILLFSAFEQMGGEWMPFIDFLLEKKPARVIHVDPMLEWYDRSSLIDYLAYRFHKARGYLSGYVSEFLEPFEVNGTIKVIHTQRVKCGNTFQDGYSFDVWAPA